MSTIINEYKVSQINRYIQQLHSSYILNEWPDNLVYKLRELSIDEKCYLNSNLNLHKIAKVDKDDFFIHQLCVKEKREFCIKLLASEVVELNVNIRSSDGKSCFEFISMYCIEQAKSLRQNYMSFTSLYKLGYTNRPEDLSTLRKLYDKNVKSPEALQIWSYCRFAYILANSTQIDEAFRKDKILFTILSFKMGKPVGVHYPNLLGIANNALHHYGSSSRLIIRAIHHYNMYEKIISKDQKGTFKYRYDEVLETEPIQDEEFEAIILKIFPELN